MAISGASVAGVMLVGLLAVGLGKNALSPANAGETHPELAKTRAAPVSKSQVKADGADLDFSSLSLIVANPQSNERAEAGLNTGSRSIDTNRMHGSLGSGLEFGAGEALGNIENLSKQLPVRFNSSI